jgi:hypothetical protein
MEDKTKNQSTEQGASVLRRALGVVRKVLQFLAMALVMGWIAGAAVRWDAKLGEAPGFFRGMLHGAIMPMAWPTLLAGQEQEIYSARNSGRTYKLGYSMGVNACGLVFFGFTFLTFIPRSKLPIAEGQRQKLQ